MTGVHRAPTTPAPTDPHGSAAVAHPDVEPAAEPDAEPDAGPDDAPAGRAVPDWVVVAAGVTAWFAARWSGPVPLAVGVAAAAAALLTRRTSLVLVGTLLLVAALGQRAWAGLDPPPPGPFDERVTLVTDPVRAVSGTSAVVRTSQGRLLLRTHASAARSLRPLLAGQPARVVGRVTPYDMERIASRPDRRVVGTLDAEQVTAVGEAALTWRLANGVRGLLERGAVSLPADQRSLLAGLVLGDDRAQSPVVIDAFEGAGLTHLLAVSGQNVAFVLAAAAPFLVRLRLWPRCVTTATLLLFFAVVTRFEPSVLRAVTMALVAAIAATLGRPLSGTRILAGAVVVLLVVDPLLVHSIGFQLSVAATAGILLLAPPLARVVPGPRPLALALSVPLAAQLATGPLIVAIGGTVPLAALVANVAVEPAAGAVMTWGSSVGIVAGVVGGPIAAVLHLPTRALLWWITTVATRASAAPLGTMAGLATVVAVAAAVVVALGRRHGRRGVELAGALVLGALLLASVPLRAPVPGAAPGLPVGARLVIGQSGAVVVVVERPVDPARLLRGLRQARVRRVDLLVVTSPSGSAWRSVGPVLDRFDPRVLRPSSPDGEPLAPGARYAVDDLTVEVVAVTPRLRVEVFDRNGVVGLPEGAAASDPP